MTEFWQGLGRGARATLIGGVLVIVCGIAALGAWALRPDYEVLFSNLSGPDAAAMTAELDRMKQAYKLGPDGTSILVERASVHQVRLKLMGKDLPLHGAVGFELFNNSDFGMTEFAQKVNYQRALQGEITRTILSLDEVESVRVHLAMPEEGLFKNEQNRPKAAVTLGLRNGRSLRKEQVSGIQRLVAAAVPGILAQDVTITNQQGVALTRGAQAEAAAESGALDMKREVERHLSRKATEVLEKAFGAGNALTSVDVVLDMNQVRVTKEEVLGAPGRPEEVATGIVVRERESAKDAAGPSRDANGPAGGSTTRDVEYQVGRRVEQIVSQPGSIVRLQVAAVLKASVDPGREEQARALLAAAVGASKERGDVIVVQAIHEIGETARSPAGANANAGEVKAEALRGPVAAALAEPALSSARVVIWLGGLALVVSLCVVVALLVRVRGRRPADGGLAPEMGASERAAALAQIREWLREPVTTAPGRSA